MSKHSGDLGGASGAKGGGSDLFDAIPLGYEAALLGLKSNQCRWPIGHPNECDFHFCTAKRVNGRLSYCEAHQWDAALKKRSGRPTVDSLGDTARRTTRSRDAKSTPVTTAGAAPGVTVGIEGGQT